MRQIGIFRHHARRTLTVEVRRRLFARCLNREFDTLLEEVKSIPLKSIEENFLKLYLIKSVQFAHVPSVEYLWYRCVLRLGLLIVKPELLCGIGNISLQENKCFIPEQLYAHFLKFYGKGEDMEDYNYELLRIKVESFAKGTGTSVSFREKWKVFVEDIDNKVDPKFCFSARDFPYLTTSMRGSDKEVLLRLLLSESRLNIRNGSTLTVLLNMVLLQEDLDNDFKLSLFQLFQQKHKFLNYEETTTILFKNCQGNAYRSSILMDLVREKELTISHLAAKFFLESVKDSEYSFKATDYIAVVRDQEAFTKSFKMATIRDRSYGRLSLGIM